MASKHLTDNLRSRASRSTLRISGAVAGVDGGGTKTRAVVVDGSENVLGVGTSGPSNPLRVGVREAADSVREAVERACGQAGVRMRDLVAAEVGLAGVRRSDLRERMRAALASELRVERVEVVTDADIALFGATGGEPGLVVIAGTGSVCCGANARGRRAWSGGWGPTVGDEGSGSWIAQHGLRAVARASDGRGDKTRLTAAACDYFNVATADDLALAVYAPGMTNDRLAGFAKQVIEAAKAGDVIAREILAQAGRELGLAAVAVIRKLRMERESFRAGYVGGVFAAGGLILEPLAELIAEAAPRACLSKPQLSPPEAAARMAREQVRLALAG